MFFKRKAKKNIDEYTKEISLEYLAEIFYKYRKDYIGYNNKNIYDKHLLLIFSTDTFNDFVLKFKSKNYRII